MFPVFTGPARISTMIQNAQSVASVAATATGMDREMLMMEASSLSVEAMAAVTSAAAMSSGMPSGMVMEGAASRRRGDGSVGGLGAVVCVVVAAGAGVLLLL